MLEANKDYAAQLRNIDYDAKNFEKQLMKPFPQIVKKMVNPRTVCLCGQKLRYSGNCIYKEYTTICHYDCGLGTHVELEQMAFKTCEAIREGDGIHCTVSAIEECSLMNLKH